MNPVSYSIPLVISGVGLLFLLSKKNLFEDFVQGAKEGLQTSFGLLPPLIALIVCISMFRASGMLSIVTVMLSPVFSLLRIPEEVTPFIIMRPLSGSGSTALLNDLFTAYGPDSAAGKIASVIMGSSDTVFYIFAVYFGSAGIKKTRHALLCALAVQLFCAAFASLLILNS